MIGAGGILDENTMLIRCFSVQAANTLSDGQLRKDVKSEKVEKEVENTIELIMELLLSDCH